MADALKAEGNKLFAEKRFEESIEKFTQAIELDSSNHVLYSNRSGSYASIKDFDHALQDAIKVTEIKPDWPKGWTRKAAALHGQGDLLGANDAFEQALTLDPNNAQAKSGLQAVKRAIDAEARSAGADPTGGLNNMFSDPSLIQKLASNPKTSGLLGDAEFMRKLQTLKQNPNAIGEALQDPRMLQVMSVLLGVDMQFGAPPGGEGAGASAKPTEVEEDVPMPDLVREEKKAPEPEPEVEAEPEDEEAVAKRQAKEKADEEKKLGTEHYKKRNFDAAIEHYSKAWEIYKDITYLTNLGAAKFEKGDYEGAIEACKQAVEHGREELADFKLIAKAFGRIGSAYEKMGDLATAIEYFQKSLTEHRTPDVLSKLRAAEKAKIKAEKESYINPEEAEKARELGNARFKEAKWPEAVEAYTEMIKRAPDDPRGYSNRAACFIKLLSFPSAVQDCDEAIKKDPSFVRAYIRKAQAYLGMQEYSKSIDVCTEAQSIDVDRKNAGEIQDTMRKAMEAQYSAREGETEEQARERIQRNPEIVQLLSDPVMQSILQQAQENPGALQEHMKNPMIRRNIERLVAAGVIRLGR